MSKYNLYGLRNVHISFLISFYQQIHEEIIDTKYFKTVIIFMKKTASMSKQNNTITSYHIIYLQLFASQNLK